MPFYHGIDPQTGDGQRTITRLQALRTQLDADVPTRTLEETLLLGTWNLREFGAGKHGGRRDESIATIAEIVSRFDVVALQEVNKDLSDLNRLLGALGPSWKHLVTDTTAGRPGNNERVAFVFDTRKVTFGGVAGEVVLPPRRVRRDGKTFYEPATQLWRTPGICGFHAGWTRFLLATVHITWGESHKAPPARVKEIEAIAKFLYKRSLDEDAWARNIVLLGDFNIFSSDDDTFAALSAGHFEVPEALQQRPSNAGKTRHFDPIALRRRKGSLEPTGNAGVFDYYQSVFAESDEKTYAKAMGPAYLQTSKGTRRSAKARSTFYRSTWRTYQMSDHLPMWIELRIDHSDAYLKRLHDQANPG